MTDEIIEQPFNWNDNLSEMAQEDFSMIRQSLSYGTATSIGMALAKLELLEKQGCKVEPQESEEISREEIAALLARGSEEMTREEAKVKTFDILRFIADNAGLSMFEAIEKAYYMGLSEQEPKTGHWIKTISENGITSAVRCSECGFEDNRYMLFRYCPNCGCRMVEPQERNGV